MFKYLFKEYEISFWTFFYILFVVFVVEFFTYIRKNELYFKKTKETGTQINYDYNSKESKKFPLDKYSTNSDIEIKHSSGKFYVNNDNIFIKIKDRVIIPEINVIYNINEPFTLEIINMTGENINYYYKKI